MMFLIQTSILGACRKNKHYFHAATLLTLTMFPGKNGKKGKLVVCIISPPTNDAHTSVVLQ